MKKYIAVFEVEDDCNILTMDAEIKYTYETNGTNYVMQEDIEFVRVEEQQPCEDLINQRATTCRHGGHCEWVACDKCNHYESDALSQQPCDDCISRQAVIEITAETGALETQARVRALPPVTPKEKTGKWETGYSLPDGEYWKCMSCGEFIKVRARGMDYCGHCGARMEV